MTEVSSSATVQLSAVEPANGSQIEFTLINSQYTATKRYSLDSRGKLTKDEPGLSAGTALRKHLSTEGLLADLAALLKSLRFDQVIVCGAMNAPGDNLQLTTKAQLASQPGAIARTEGWAAYEAGRPALVMLDHDAKDLPDHLRQRLHAEGGLLAVLTRLCPEFGKAGVLIRPSVSNGIRIKATGEVLNGGGQHVYIPVQDGGDALRFVRALHAHLIIGGWAFVTISKAGVATIKSLLDVAASDPERLVFEADAALVHGGLEHVPDSRCCVVQRDGVLFDTTTLPDPPYPEIQAAEVALLAAAQSRIDQARQARASISGGAPSKPPQAGTGLAFPATRLDPSTVIFLDGHPPVVVSDMLREPGVYVGKTGGDPDEPDYGGGRNKAIWHLKPGERKLGCHSLAHGGLRYEAYWTHEDVIAAWQARRDPREILTMQQMWPAEGEAAERALEAAGVPQPLALEFSEWEEELRTVPDLVAKRDGEALRRRKQVYRGAFDDAVALAEAGGRIKSGEVASLLSALPASLPSSSSPAAAGLPWYQRIEQNAKGPKPTLTNAHLALGEGCCLLDHLWRDTATNRLLLTGPMAGSRAEAALGLKNARPAYADPITGLPVYEWTDPMLTTVRVYLEQWDVAVSKDNARDIAAQIGELNAHSSVADYLRGLTWDGVSRLDGWLVQHAGAEATKFNHVVLGKWMIGAVARALRPEEQGEPAQLDTVLTLVGSQGARKSSFIRSLCAVPPWHSENALGDLNSKDAVQRIASTWIADMAEGASLRANEVETFKQFITATADNIRLPYAATVSRLVRRTAFAMTVNADGVGFLKDGTGNRRFWVVNVTMIDIAQAQSDRDQLWAEAVHLFDAGTPWWFNPADPADAAIEAEAAAAAETHRAQTPVEEAIRRYIDYCPVVDQRGRVEWTRRPAPLTVIISLTDSLAEMGHDWRNKGVCNDARRALNASGWKEHRVKARGALRDQTVWIAPAGVKTLRSGSGKGHGRSFTAWLAKQETAGAVAKPCAVDGDEKSDATGRTDQSTAALF